MDELENFNIEASGELDKLSQGHKDEISERMTDFLTKNSKKFNEAHLNVNVKHHKEKLQKKPQVHVKMNLNTDRGSFHSSDDDWGVVLSVRKNLEHLQSQIDKKFGKMENRASIRKQALESVLQ